MTDTPRYHPATPNQIRTRRGISSAPREYELILLMWQDDEFTWQAIHGQWCDMTNRWIADPVLTRSRDLPATPTHWNNA
jgi:hypothetical protein